MSTSDTHRAAGTVARSLRAPMTVGVAAAFSWLGACGEDPRGIVDVETDGSTRVAIVSDPVTPEVGASQPASVDGSSVVYVSLSPGTFTDGSAAAVTNLESGTRALIALVDGGFDPVAFSASVGTALDFEVFADTRTLAEWREIVQPDRPPIVVRTYPPRGKRDVPVTSSMVVVFSEPIDGSTVNATTIRLLRDEVQQPGTVALTVDGLNATFTPDDPLAAGAAYALSIAAATADRDGQGLGTEYTAPFTTSASDDSGPARSRMLVHAGDSQTDTVLAELATPLQVLVLDGDGSPIAGAPVAWEAPWGANSSGWFPRFAASGTHVATSTTGADGIASARVILGSRPGPYLIHARGAAGVVGFQVSVAAGKPVSARWTRDPYYVYRGYGTWHVGITNVSLEPVVVGFFDAHGNEAPLASPIVWSLVSGAGTITNLGGASAVATPHADGPLVFTATPSSGVPALTDTIYGVATIVLTVGAEDGHCEEGSFVPGSVTVDVGRWVAWSICDDGYSGWEEEAGTWVWSYEHNVQFEDGTVTWESTTDDWRPHFRVFTTAGTYRYRCTLHSAGFDDPSGEVGTVTVIG